MRCSRLTIARSAIFCEALKMRYLPSQFELEEYCRTKEHRKCPFYLKGIVSACQPEKDSRTASLRRPQDCMVT